ncbi:MULTISPECIES: ABC transporter permease [Actinomycetes]|uniref:ABC transporter permease n=2 Tax=Actinomycetes TaxID=1760 RepID=A0ABP6M4B7_9MICC
MAAPLSLGDTWAADLAVGSLRDWAQYGLGIAVMGAATVVLLRRSGIRLGALPLVALVRAAAQLTLIALLLQGVLTAPWTVVLFILLMLSTASATSFRRAKELPRGPAGAVLGVLIGGTMTVAVVLLLGLVAWETEKIIAIAGITIGNCMTASTLAMRRFASSLQQRSGEVEAWLSLGARPAQATTQMRREAVREALLPNLDQTKNTGLVTLPGAFVGALFGGASPVEAAQFQLVVLAAIGLAGSVTALLGTWWAARSPRIPLQAASS